jgi:hypothetical protein
VFAPIESGAFIHLAPYFFSRILSIIALPIRRMNEFHDGAAC